MENLKNFMFLDELLVSNIGRRQILMARLWRQHSGDRLDYATPIFKDFQETATGTVPTRGFHEFGRTRQRELVKLVLNSLKIFEHDLGMN